MTVAADSKRNKTSKAPSNRKPKVVTSRIKRQSSSTATAAAAKQSKRPLIAATTPSPDTKPSTDDASPRVRFDSVQIKEYPLALGDFDEYNQPMDYALALDWLQQDDDPSQIIIQPLDKYEASKPMRYKSLVEYSELGRLSVSDRCKRLLQTMNVSDLALQVGQRYGKSTARGIGRVEQDLQAFLELSVNEASSTKPVLPPFVKKA